MIEDYGFGWYIIDGKRYEYDITIIKGKVGTWNREDHLMKEENVLPLIKSNPDVIVIGNGASGCIEVREETIDAITAAGIEVIVKNTKDACSTFNRLVKQGKKVAGIFHATC